MVTMQWIDTFGCDDVCILVHHERKCFAILKMGSTRHLGP